MSSFVVFFFNVFVCCLFSMVGVKGSCTMKCTQRNVGMLAALKSVSAAFSVLLYGMVVDHDHSGIEPVMWNVFTSFLLT